MVASLHIKVQRASKMLAMVSTTTTILENLIKRDQYQPSTEPKDEYLEAIKSVARSGVGGLRRYCIQSFDRADEKETAPAVKYSWDNRNKPISDEEEIEAGRSSLSPGRKGKYNDYVWTWKKFFWR